MISRGDDVRGSDESMLSLGKLYGNYGNSQVVGPDPFYQIVILKDESKANKVGRSEYIGATRHRDPLLCAVNAAATMLLLRFGEGGMIGQLPDFFDAHCDWPNEQNLLTKHDCTGCLPYAGSKRAPGHKEIFDDMKQASGLIGAMSDCSTKLRSFGAMHASQLLASAPEIERAGR